jgi:hypothetical protein
MRSTTFPQLAATRRYAVFGRGGTEDKKMGLAHFPSLVAISAYVAAGFQQLHMKLTRDTD